MEEKQNQAAGEMIKVLMAKTKQQEEDNKVMFAKTKEMELNLAENQAKLSKAIDRLVALRDYLGEDNYLSILQTIDSNKVVGNETKS